VNTIFGNLSRQLLRTKDVLSKFLQTLENILLNIGVLMMRTKPVAMPAVLQVVSAVIWHCSNGNTDVCFLYKLRAPAVVVTLVTLSIFCWV
jgi:hypothetical protein